MLITNTQKLKKNFKFFEHFKLKKIQEKIYWTLREKMSLLV